MVRPEPQPFPIMSKYTAFRCPEDLLELAKVKAKRDRRSLSNYIITLIEKDVKDVSGLKEEADINGEFKSRSPVSKTRQ
jgi:predicted DNA-binding protein